MGVLIIRALLFRVYIGAPYTMYIPYITYFLYHILYYISYQGDSRVSGQVDDPLLRLPIALLEPGST